MFFTALDNLNFLFLVVSFLLLFEISRIFSSSFFFQILSIIFFFTLNFLLVVPSLTVLKISRNFFLLNFLLFLNSEHYFLHKTVTGIDLPTVPLAITIEFEVPGAPYVFGTPPEALP